MPGPLGTVSLSGGAPTTAFNDVIGTSASPIVINAGNIVASAGAATATDGNIWINPSQNLDHVLRTVVSSQATTAVRPVEMMPPR